MGKLYFRYGAMGSSKTANLLMVHYNFLERGETSGYFEAKTGYKRRRIYCEVTHWLTGEVRID